MPSKLKLLITGANGLLGRAAVSALAAHHDVHAVVHTLPAEPIAGATYYPLDFAADWSMQDLPAGVDTLYHFAQSSHFREFPDRALNIFRVNIDSTARLLDYAHRTGVKRFVYASSGGVYGAGAQPFHENSPITTLGQLGYYLGSKLCGEILAENYSPFMKIVVLRFFFMYGRGQKRSMLLPRLVDSVRAGLPISLQGGNGLRLNPVHVGDAVRAVEKALSIDESCKLNIAGAEVLSLREIAELIGGLVGRAPVFQDATGDPSHLIANIDAMREKLCVPAITLWHGLSDLL